MPMAILVRQKTRRLPLSAARRGGIDGGSTMRRELRRLSAPALAITMSLAPFPQGADW
jgi:hypothetical protein